ALDNLTRKLNQHVGYAFVPERHRKQQIKRRLYRTAHCNLVGAPPDKYPARLRLRKHEHGQKPITKNPLAVRVARTIPVAHTRIRSHNRQQTIHYHPRNRTSILNTVRRRTNNRKSATANRLGLLGSSFGRNGSQKFQVLVFGVPCVVSVS